MFSYEIRLRPEAAYELDQVFLWYEKEAKGLGFRFLEYYNQTVVRIKTNPHHSFNVYKHIRRAVLNKFPYVIYYSIEADIVIILAVLHQSRNPRMLRKRL